MRSGRGVGGAHTNVRDVESGVVLRVGDYVVVGNEEADPAVAEVVSVDARGIVLVRVLPGSADTTALWPRREELGLSVEQVVERSGLAIEEVEAVEDNDMDSPFQRLSRFAEAVGLPFELQ